MGRVATSSDEVGGGFAGQADDRRYRHGFGLRSCAGPRSAAVELRALHRSDLAPATVSGILVCVLRGEADEVLRRLGGRIFSKGSYTWRAPDNSCPPGYRK